MISPPSPCSTPHPRSTEKALGDNSQHRGREDMKTCAFYYSAVKIHKVFFQMVNGYYSRSERRAMAIQLSSQCKVFEDRELD